MLSNVKVGDEVRSVINGWGEITRIIDKWYAVDFPHRRYVAYYYIDGRKDHDDLYPEIVEVQKKKKWKPEGGSYFIRGDGSIGMARKIPNDTPDYYKEEGRAYPTKELAEKAYKMIRPYQRLVAYVLEHAPDWEPDWDDEEQDKCFLVYDHDFKCWELEITRFSEFFNTPMPEKVAGELCEKLNSGEVVL